MDLLDFNTDGPKSQDGVWVTMSGGGRIKIARMDNPLYLAKLQEQRAEHGTREPTDDETKKLLIDAVSETILLDWEGIELDGEAVDCTPEYARRVFAALPNFLEHVVQLAYRNRLFREDDIDDVVKLLAPTSDG